MFSIVKADVLQISKIANEIILNLTPQIQPLKNNQMDFITLKRVGTNENV